ncbi:putative rhs element Vgr protein [Burkholderia pseudomallei MSHR5613]|nr:putative rhs element Vgr protein [Burkholderia pseudomallei MSHR5613]
MRTATARSPAIASRWSRGSRRCAYVAIACTSSTSTRRTSASACSAINLVSDYYALIVLRLHTAVSYQGYVGIPNELRQVLAPLLQAPKNEANLPK